MLGGKNPRSPHRKSNQNIVQWAPPTPSLVSQTRAVSIPIPKELWFRVIGSIQQFIWNWNRSWNPTRNHFLIQNSSFNRQAERITVHNSWFWGSTQLYHKRARFQSTLPLPHQVFGRRDARSPTRTSPSLTPESLLSWSAPLWTRARRSRPSWRSVRPSRPPRCSSRC